MKYLNLLLLFFCCLISSSLLAQTSPQIEADLLKSFKKIDYWDQQRSNDTTLASYDSLDKANNFFAKKLKGYVEKYPSTITHPFKSLVKEHLDISNSTDGLFRIYSWDTEAGGTMHFFESVFQYRYGSKTYAVLDTPKMEGDGRPNYQRMYTFKANGKAYYLACYLTIGSSKDAGNGIHVFTIDDGKLKDAKLIKTHSGLHDDLDYDYNFFSIVDIPFEKRPSIRFESTTNTIYLPLVDGNRNVTKKFIEYKFTGQYFERVKN